jgi:PAS domain S-box-containing protein
MAAAAVRLYFLQMIGNSFIFVTFSPAAMLAALYGGLGPGLLAVAVSALLADFFWTVPAGRLFDNTVAEWLGLSIFVCSSTMIVIVTSALHRTRIRAREAELQHAVDEQYRLLFDINPNPMWVFDEETLAFLAVNEAAVKLYGWTREEFLAMTVADIRPQTDIPLLKQKVAEQAGVKACSVGTWQHCRKDGSPIDVEITVSSLPFADRPGRLAMMNDVTDHRLADETLQQERDLLQAIMNGAKNSHLVYLDRDFNFVRVNETYATTCGYRPEEMTGKNHFSLYPDAENEAIFAHVRDSGEAVNYHDKPFEFPDQPERGMTYWDWSLTPVKNAESRVIGLVFSLFETTARKLAEEALHQQKERLRLALAAAGMASWDWHVPSGTVVWNEMHYRMMGYEPGELQPTYQAWADRVHPDDLEATQSMIQTSMALGTTYTTEFRTLWPDGTIRWLEARGEFEYDADRHPTHCYGVMLDITERKWAEDELLRAKLEWERTFDSVPDLIAVINEQHRIVRVNKAMADYLGAAALDYTGLHCYGSIHGTDHAPAFCPHTLTLASGSRHEAELFIESLGADFLVTTTPLLDENDNLLGSVHVARNISERKRVEEALAQAKTAAEQRAEELAAVLEAVPAAVWIATDPECLHIEGNRTANELLRLPEGGEASLSSPASIRPTHFQVVKDGRKLQSDELPVQMAARGIELHDFEETLVFDDGTIRHLFGNATPLFDEQGELRGSVAAFVDITLRKQAEDDLQKLNVYLEQRVASRTEELRQKDLLLLKQSRLAAMGEMINNIAHQWRQPLNVLGLNIQQLLLFYDMGEFSREFLEKCSNDAMKQIHHMSQTIDDFRNFFRPDKEKTSFRLEESLHQTLSLVHDGLQSSQIEVVTQVQGDPLVTGYFNEFCQVLLNIINNARDAIVERRIPAGKVIITATSGNSRTVISISDNAGGIPADIIGQIFEPYFSTKGVQGTGIGLFMAKNIIEKSMEGNISVQNTLEGAEFRIEVCTE